jgi:hypothetical protein
VTLVKAYLLHLNVPLPAEEIKFESLVRTVLTNASKFIYSKAIGILTGFTGFFLDLILVLFVAFFLFLQGDDFIAEIKKLSPLSAADNEMIVGEMEATIKATLWSTVVVAFIQGFLGGVGFFAVWGAPGGFLGDGHDPRQRYPRGGRGHHLAAGGGLPVFTGRLTKALGSWFLRSDYRHGGQSAEAHAHARLPLHAHGFCPPGHPGGHFLLRHDRLHPGSLYPFPAAVHAGHLRDGHPGACAVPPGRGAVPPPPPEPKKPITPEGDGPGSAKGISGA